MPTFQVEQTKANSKLLPSTQVTCAVTTSAQIECCPLLNIFLRKDWSCKYTENLYWTSWVLLSTNYIQVTLKNYKNVRANQDEPIHSSNLAILPPLQRAAQEQQGPMVEGSACKGFDNVTLRSISHRLRPLVDTKLSGFGVTATAHLLPQLSPRASRRPSQPGSDHFTLVTTVITSGVNTESTLRRPCPAPSRGHGDMWPYTIPRDGGLPSVSTDPEKEPVQWAHRPLKRKGKLMAVSPPYICSEV